MAFKVATDEQDALGQLAHADAWRFFLLHHQDFIAPYKLPSGEETTVAKVALEFWRKFYPNFQLPRNFGQDERYMQAKMYCVEHLEPIIGTWNVLKQVIQEAQRYPTEGYPAGTFVPVSPVVPGIPLEAYPVRIHTDPFYRKRWLDLMREGYLVSRPFPRPDHEGQLDEYDIPADPRILEPFVMRVHYFFNTVNVDQNLKDLYLGRPLPNR
jgi:hypothetical protein